MAEWATKWLKPREEHVATFILATLPTLDLSAEFSVARAAEDVVQL